MGVSVFYNVTEQLELEGTSKTSSFQGAGMPLTGLCCSGPIQPALQPFQGWAISNFPGQPVPGPHHPLSVFGSRAPPWCSQQCFGKVI